MIRQQGILILFLLSALTLSCNSEKNREIFDDFDGEEGVYMIKLPPGLFLNMLDSGLDLTDSDLGNIDFIKLLVFDESKATDRDSDDILASINDKFNKFGYEMAIQFSSSVNNISAYILENEEHISDLMIIVDADESVIGLGLSGQLDGRAIMNFASEVDYDSLRSIIEQ